MDICFYLPAIRFIDQTRYSEREKLTEIIQLIELAFQCATEQIVQEISNLILK